MIATLAFAAPAGAADAVSGQLIVRFKPSAEAETAVRAAGGRVISRLGSIESVVVRPRSAVKLAVLRRALGRRGDVRYVEPDAYLDKSATPDDPYLVRQYALGEGTGGIAAPAAWNVRTTCAKVAVLDSGVQYDHPDLKANIWHNPHEVKNNEKDDDHNGWVDDYYGVNIPNGRGSGKDDDGHGTHVAGIIGGRSNNAEGIAGTCWSTKIIPIRFMNGRGRGAASDAIKGIDYAIKAGAKVINCSFGTSSKTASLEDAIERAAKKGVLVVVAAGNDGKSLGSSPTYPASYTDGNIVTVAATTEQDTLADFSNYDKKAVDLGAPGDSIFSTYPTSRFKSLSGTSMAAPFVAATAAMLRSRDPDLTPGQLRSKLLSTVDPVPALEGRTVTGGRLNLLRALQSIS